MSKAPFDWMDPRRNPERGKIEKARREAMYRGELEERAALLHRLGYTKDKARARLAANLAWDFPAGAKPLDDAALDAIVDRLFNNAAFGRDGAPSGRAAPRGKGGNR